MTDRLSSGSPADAPGPTTRHLSDADAKALPAGGDHYTAYVGPPEQYDVMGASQFNLLTTLGLRAHHRVLDLGCGSLRLGRLLIPFLDSARYTGIEPNPWLVEEAIARQLGADLVRLKAPLFHTRDDFRVDLCPAADGQHPFDVIVAQSIFSHTGVDLMRTAFVAFGNALTPDGIALFTVLHPGQDGVVEFHGTGWVYPGCVGHTPEMVGALLGGAGLVGRALPWFHPRQTWYIASRNPARIPDVGLDAFLRGPILNVAPWARSLSV